MSCRESPLTHISLTGSLFLDFSLFLPACGVVREEGGGWVSLLSLLSVLAGMSWLYAKTTPGFTYCVDIVSWVLRVAPGLLDSTTLAIKH